MQAKKKHLLWPILLITFSLGLLTDGAVAGDVRINIGLSSQRSAVDLGNTLSKYKGRQIRAIPQINMVTYTVPEEAFEELKTVLLSSGDATFVEKDQIRTIPTPVDPDAFGAEMIPNDPLYPNQWGPECIKAEQAWDFENLYVHPDLIVAVIDSGVDLDHPDLVNQVDTSIDWDFVNNDNNAMDDNGHGTHCAGTIAAQINNAVGVAGLVDVTIMAVKGLDSLGSGWDSDLASSLVYAADNGAKVISNSWGGYGKSSALENATLYAFRQGAVVVAAAGNDGISSAFIPAAYPWVIGVAALQNCTSRVSWSNYGSENVYISAPGVSIYSTLWNDRYGYNSGTSMACPHVAGVAAMWVGAYAPYVTLTPLQVMYLMLGTADDLGTPGYDIYYGFGRVDMFPWAD
jgi:subtilisin family serine protease